MFKKDFPFLKKYVYLNSASGCLKPRIIVKAIKKFYLKYPMNVHALDSAVAQKVWAKINETRELIAQLTQASLEEVIFTSGTTDSLNKSAQLMIQLLKENDEILLSPYNHVSNIIPWIEIAKIKKVKIIYTTNFLKSINSKTKMIAFSQMNNTIDQKINLQKLIKVAQEKNIILINDAAQAIAHQKVSLKWFDLICFSGNKIYGPTGIGTLIIKKKILKKVKPTTFGGGAVAWIKKNNQWQAKNNFLGFEPGTLNTAGIIGLGAAIKYFLKHQNFQKEKKLAVYAYEKLQANKNIKFLSQKGDLILVFNYHNLHAQDVVSYLSRKKIILRAGDHCAKLTNQTSIRLSIAIYNQKKDINKVCYHLQKINLVK